MKVFYILKGINIENAAYSLCNCAERTAIFTGIANGMKLIKYVFVTADTQETTQPCGACRQVINEFGDKDTKIICSNLTYDYKTFTLDEILPFSFGRQHLE